MTAQAEFNLRWGFSTLGCPEYSLNELCELGAAFNMREIELRTVSHRMDLDLFFSECDFSAEQAKAMCIAHEVQFRVMASSFKLIESSEIDRANFVRYCEWANSWKAPFVRVFSGGVWGQPFEEKHFKEAVESVLWWQKEKMKRGWKIGLLLETHDALCSSTRCLELMQRLDRPISILWDSHHTWRIGGETPSKTWEMLSPWICQVHVKDSIFKPSARHPFTYVLPGEGEMPLVETIDLLRAKKFDGVVSLEWEKQWHPYLPSLEVALKHLQRRRWFRDDECTRLAIQR